MPWKTTTDPNQNQQASTGTNSCQGGCQSPAYSGYDKTKDVESYNCAGLAHRNYTLMGDVNGVKQELAKGKQIKCGDKCPPGNIKHWLWEYDVQLEDADGNRTAANRDFHTVAGQVDQNGNDPADVYSKNGKRPIEGPGTGPSFKPKPKEQALSNDRNATPAVDNRGRPIDKIRSNMTETCYCMPPP